MNLGHCAKLIARPENRTWFRAVLQHHETTTLQTSHTRAYPSRYNPGNHQFEILYFAWDHTTALYEVQAMLGAPLHGVTMPNPYQAWIILNVDVTLDHVVDLADVTQQSLLQTSAQELTGDWRSYRLRGRTTPVSQPAGVPAPTQELGAALFGVPAIEGFWTLSARVPTSKILAIFPEKLRRPGGRSSVEFRDQNGNVIQRIP